MNIYQAAVKKSDYRNAFYFYSIYYSLLRFLSLSQQNRSLLCRFHCVVAEMSVTALVNCWCSCLHDCDRCDVK